MPVRRVGLLCCVLVLVGVAGETLLAQVSGTPREMYGQWCAVCHGEDGRGRPPQRPVKTDPIDFTDCRLTTAESDIDWTRVVEFGGIAAGRSSEMPGFEMLDAPAVRHLVEYIRGFCREPKWPSGNLNFPRAVFTAKAFPEDEVVLQPMVTHGQPTNLRVRIEASYARRVGRRAQIELGLPGEAVSWVNGLVSGTGDLRLEGKYALFASAERATILSAGLETTLPSGSRRWGFGEGTFVAEPYLALGLLRHDFFVQADMRLLLPAKHFPTEPVRYFAYNAALTRSLSATPTAWTIGVELNGVDRALGITPEVVKGLTRTGSLSAGFGVRISVMSPRPYTSDVTRWTGYLLWDYLEPFRARP